MKRGGFGGFGPGEFGRRIGRRANGGHGIVQLFKRVDPPRIALAKKRKHRREPTGWPEGIEIGHEDRVLEARTGARSIGDQKTKTKNNNTVNEK
jgi:hypothetical protein